MKRHFFYSIIALLFCLPVWSNATKNEKPFVIPELREWKGEVGHFAPTSNARICIDRNKTLQRIALQFAADYNQLFNKKLKIVNDAPKEGDFSFVIKKDHKLNNEGYTIKIANQVVISATDTTGLFWGTRTILQLSEQNKNQYLPKGIINDYPDYELRGFMLDCGRKFIPMHFLRDYVRIMSYYKMNTFQIHLNDNAFSKFANNDFAKTNAAFRLECDTYPGLTAEDGFYTKKEFIELQQLAESLGVEIIPEIDVPAHSLAFTQYKPEIASKEYGMDHLDLFNPETYRFVDGLLDEYLRGSNPVFRGKRVHIGTDEYSNKKIEVVEKFRYFTDYYIRFVEKYGKQACVWGALTHAKGETPVKAENVVMGAWYNGYADPAEMIKQGYHLISVPDGLLYIVPAAGYYYDYLNTEYLYKSWTPAHIGKAVFEEKHKQILGGMFAVWNDHYGNGISTKDIHDRVFPSMQTLAVKMWNGATNKLPYSDFCKQQIKISEAPGVNIAGRVGNSPQCVYSAKSLTPNSSTPLKEIGYNYTVSFDVNGVSEDKGTQLTSSIDAIFYLADPIEGKLGFTRDGYLYTFNYKIKSNEQSNFTICGDNKSTRLYINGKLRENMDIQKRYYNAGKDSMSYVRTLVFPLEKTGGFKSTINNFNVYNYNLK